MNEDLETIIKEVYSCYGARYGNAIVDLNQRIDKAIEYIKTWCYDEYSIAIKTGDKTCSSEPKAIDKLLDILKGSDKE